MNRPLNSQDFTFICPLKRFSHCFMKVVNKIQDSIFQVILTGSHLLFLVTYEPKYTKLISIWLSPSGSPVATTGGKYATRWLTTKNVWVYNEKKFDGWGHLKKPQEISSSTGKKCVRKSSISGFMVISAREKNLILLSKSQAIAEHGYTHWWKGITN